MTHDAKETHMVAGKAPAGYTYQIRAYSWSDAVHMVGEHRTLCAPGHRPEAFIAYPPTHDPSRVTCPLCLALLERPAELNPSIELGEE